jgi:hypothetical protein|nr:hypothetical protein [Deltaproteobacteria bacterium]
MEKSSKLGGSSPEGTVKVLRSVAPTVTALRSRTMRSSEMRVPCMTPMRRTFGAVGSRVAFMAWVIAPGRAGWG